MSFLKLFYVSVWITFKPEALFKPAQQQKNKLLVKVSFIQAAVLSFLTKTIKNSLH